jgi:hypothetical protein
MSPGFSFLRLALFLAAARLLSDLNKGHLAMGLKQLSGIIMNFDLSHPHDAILLRCLEQKDTQ